MIMTKAQAKYLKNLINVYADTNAQAYYTACTGTVGEYQVEQRISDAAKLKIDNYIAKLTETDK